MDIIPPESSRLILDDCRRLTGPSLVWDKTGAILDCRVTDFYDDQILVCWYHHLRDLLETIGWQDRAYTHRQFDNGFNLLLEAPLDQLYTATRVLEVNWYLSSCELLSLEAEPVGPLIESIREEMQRERNPDLIALQQQAMLHRVDFLADDDQVSIGHGQGSLSWPLAEIPDSDDIPWATVHDVPVALVTGTNGKSTSVRLLDCIAKAAGQISGVTSTDFVRVGDDVLDQGDYSGPGGARLLLRDRRLEVAFLEIARGGILRRGLPLRGARAALITNVGRDHLGQYGVNTLEALIEAKFVVRKALTDAGVLVLNADDDGIVDYMSSQVQSRVCWFSLDKNHALIRRQIVENKACCFCDENQLVYFDGVNRQPVCAFDEMPMTLGGAAIHNVRNALGALGVAAAMGYSIDTIRRGLIAFRSDDGDNPGRLNLIELSNGARAIIDFAHNAHSVDAVAETVGRMSARQKWVLFSSAGDRSDDEICAIAKGVCSLKPDYVVLAEIEHYLRGRAPGEVSEILLKACLREGLTRSQIHCVDSPLSGVQYAVAQLQPGDLGLFLVLSQRDEVLRFLKQN